MMAQSSTAAEVTRAELARMGDRVPFFMTPTVTSALGLTPVKPSAKALAGFGVSPEAAAAVDYFAGTYERDGKKVLLVRLPSYTPDDENAALGYLRALFTEQEPLVDAMVFDQTHNPGGSLFFAFGVASLLAPHPIRSLVQANNADRMWIQTFATIANDIAADEPNHPLVSVMREQAHLVDEAYSARKPLSAPLPIFSDVAELSPDPAHWKKPFIMLVDELAVSCGDIVPLLVKENRLGTLFGQRTMGGGGNVEEVATLTNSRWVLNLSRGIGMVPDAKGAFPEANIIEDNGVVPDVTYSHTLGDFRSGYVGYVEAFNTTLAAQLRSAGR
jgi:C-terminal processing protease CtpA/Prc